MQKFEDAYKKEVADIKPSEEFKRDLIKKMKAVQADTVSDSKNILPLAEADKNELSSPKRVNLKKIIGFSLAAAASVAIIIGGTIFFSHKNEASPDKDIIQVADNTTTNITPEAITPNNSTGTGDSAISTASPDAETPSNNTKPISYSQLVSANLKTYGEKITVEDIKNAYSYNDSTNIMPLYNVSQTEAFNFTFNFNGYDADIDLYDYVSVHTDYECKPESKIYFTAHYEVEDDKTYYTAAPMEPMLKTRSLSEDYAYNQIDSWGNAPMYYLAIHYDMENPVPTKLENPIIIPFTVRNEVNAPNAKGVVDKTGRFKLVWEPVEGAEKYNVYKLTDGELYTGENNHAIEGAKTGYNGLTMLWEGETTDCYYDYFAGAQHGLALISDNIATYAIGQNYCVNGEFFVSAVVNGVESGVCPAIKTSQLSIPYLVEEENEILFNSYASKDEFPTEIEVLYIDGTKHTHRIAYTRTEGVDLFGYRRIQYNYSIVGTALTGYVYPEDENHELGLEWIGVPGEDFVAPMVEPVTEDEFISAMVKPDTDMTMIPDNNVATIITVDDVNIIVDENVDGINGGDNTDNIQPDGDSNIPGNLENNDDAGNMNLVEIQQGNTQEHIKLANKKTVDNVPEGVYIIADSAEEEWLALNLVQGNTDISLEAFPRLQDPYVLVDTLGKVCTQNCFILGVVSYSYDYNTLTLTVTYNLSKEEIVKMQDGFARKAQLVVDEIKSKLTDASDENKIIAFYNYLRENVEYDNDAANAAFENNMLKKDLADYEYSFNAYGALMLNKGVCQAYAAAFKLFCDISDIECTVVTGFVRGDRPHAWNEFILDGQTYEIDASYEIDLGDKPYVANWSENEFTNSLAYTRDDYYKLEN